MTRHFGMFQFKEEVSIAEIENCFATLKAMAGEILGLLEMEQGTYDSSEELNEGYTHEFITTFDSPESREAYLRHPLHEQASEVVVPRLERVVVFDYNMSERRG